MEHINNIKVAYAKDAKNKSLDIVAVLMFFSTNEEWVLVKNAKYWIG